MKKRISILLAIVMLLSMCACGSSSKGTAASDYAYYDEGYYENSDREELYEVPAEAEAGYGLAGGEYSLEVSEERNEADFQPDKIIYSADVTVETTDFTGTLAGVSELVKKYGGWIESSSVNDSNYYNKSRGYTSRRSASYSLRIPSARFTAVMESLSGLGNVPYSHTYTENVSAAYYDTEARLTAYTAQETRLLEMMGQAETVADVIALEDKLTELRYRIESLQSQLNNWDRQVSYSSIYLSVEEVHEYTPETIESPSYGQELLIALKDGLSGIGSFFKNLLVFIVGALPALIVIGAIAAVLVPLVRRRIKQRKKTAGKNKGEGAEK